MNMRLLTTQSSYAFNLNHRQEMLIREFHSCANKFYVIIITTVKSCSRPYDDRNVAKLDPQSFRGSVRKSANESALVIPISISIKNF